MSPALHATPASAGGKKQFGRGLVVGKFSPLHLGHEKVISRAIDDCDEVAVISYSQPEFPHCDAAARRRWLAGRFPGIRSLVVDDAALAKLCQERKCPVQGVPHNDAPDDEHRRFCAWLCLDVLGFLPDAVFTSESYGDGFARVLGECFTAASGHRRFVHHVCVDPGRRIHPVSGTQLRAGAALHAALHAELHAEFLSPLVRADLVERICLLGAESSGKTTLAAALAAAHGTTWVPEYGRERWIERDGRLEYADMLEIGRCQVELEERMAGTAVRYLFCDTSPLTTAFYSEAMFGRVDAELLLLADRPYDRIWLCSPDCDFVQDGTRRDLAFRDRQHAWYLAELARRNWSYAILSGEHDRRIAQAAALIATDRP